MRGYLFARTKQNKGNFWNSVKPFFTNKSGAGSEEILISENNKYNNNQHITFDFSLTTSEDVFEILKIPPKFLKHAGSEIAPIISGLINKSIEQRCFPSFKKKASVVPIYKKADKLEKGNYRPISLLPILAKIFEKVLAHQISPFLNDVLSPHLSPFRRGYSRQDALLCLLEHWRKDLLAKKKIGVRLYASRAAGVKAGSLWCSAKIF